MFWTILSVLLAIYVISVAFYIVLENRKPQSTYAWLLGFVAFPIVGLLVYYFLGRGSKTFSQEARMTREFVDGDFRKALFSQILSTDEIVDRMEAENPEDVDLDLMQVDLTQRGHLLDRPQRCDDPTGCR